jgi:hypothetical protein
MTLEGVVQNVSLTTKFRIAIGEAMVLRQIKNLPKKFSQNYILIQVFTQCQSYIGYETF